MKYISRLINLNNDLSLTIILITSNIFNEIQKLGMCYPT